jgi:glycosyltransferase involved in cell wall biosynthesis
MQLLYIAHLWSFQSLGVVKKEMAKVEALNASGCPTQALLFHPPDQTPPPCPEYIHFVPVGSVKALYQYLSGYLAKHHQQFDYFVFRYPNANHALYQLVRQYPQRFCFEHNTKELDEILHTLKPTYTFRDFLYRIRHGHFDRFTKAILTYPFQYQRLLAQERKYARAIFALSKIGFAATREIAEYEQKRCPSYPTVVVGNGIDSQKTPARKLAPYDGQTLQCLLLSGSRAIWHGVDKVIRGLQQYQGTTRIVFHAVGEFFNEEIQLANNLPPNVSVHFSGTLSGKALDELFDCCHIGISSLAPHRKNMAECTSLKTREYLIRGLPIVMAYYDTDLTGKADIAPFILSLKADETPLNFEQVINFVETLYQTPEQLLSIRSIADQYISMRSKAQQMIAALSPEN